MTPHRENLFCDPPLSQREHWMLRVCSWIVFVLAMIVIGVGLLMGAACL